MNSSNGVVSILQSYYSHVSSLEDFILLTARDEDKDAFKASLKTDGDSESYKSFLSNSYVGCTLEAACPNRVVLDLHRDDMKGIIRGVQEKALRATSGRGGISGKPKQRPITNLIAFGYTYRYESSLLRNDSLNTNVTALQSPTWDRLLKRIGIDMMVTGQPIVYLKPPATTANSERSTLLPRVKPSLKRSATDLQETEPESKRTKLSKSASLDSEIGHVGSNLKGTRRPVHVLFDIVKIFYARPSISLQTQKIVVGLPSKHILHVLGPSVPGKNNLREQMQNARHLSKYVFPREYGLANVFDSRGARSSGYADREEDIQKLGPCKTPKRLKQVVDLLEKLLWRNSKCRYDLLLDLACPSKLPLQEDHQPVDSSILLELMSEDSIYMPSQFSSVFHPSADKSDIVSTAPPASTGTAKPKFAEFICSHAQVFRFVVLVMKSVVPHQFWGSKHNFAVVMAAVKNIIATRRYESLSLHDALQGFRWNDCTWLGAGIGNKNNHLPPSDHAKRRELVEEVVYWVINAYVIPLLRTNFYVTESSAFRNRMLYFRQDDWDTLCSPLIERLTSATFRKIEASKVVEVLRQRKLGFSFVRLVPKQTGVRPIVNLRRKVAESQSINDILQAAFQILSYEKDIKPELLGSSILGWTNIYGFLKSYKIRLQNRHGLDEGAWPKLYFVKVDVQACFDTIEQKQLLKLLREIISQNEYLIMKFGQISLSADKIRRKFVKKAVPADDQPHFLRLASDMAQAFKSTIFVDQVNYPTETREGVLRLLQEHITENYVKIGDDYYQQIVGIPQGSVCSSLLCSYFYGDLERKHLQFTKDPDSALLRLIDDYLFITTDLAKAKQFLKTMQDGHPEYGCFISPDKTRTNFASEGCLSDPDSTKFPWCGLFIDTQDLSVSTDYTRFHPTYLSDSLTAERSRSPGKTFVSKMLRMGKAKSHMLHCDTALSSRACVYRNIYEHFVLVAMKMQRYLRAWGAGRVRRNAAFIYRTIQQTIRYTHASMRSRASGHTAQAHGGRFNVDKAAIPWLGATAFHTVLRAKPGAYKEVLRLLARELVLSAHKGRAFRREFAGVLQDGARLMATLSF